MIFVARNRSAGPTPAEVLAYWRSKGVTPGFDYRDVWEQEHDVAFTAAKIMRTDVLDAMRTSLDRAFAEGHSFESWQRGLRPELERMGFWGGQTVVDPLTGEAREVDVPSRLRRIFETNMRTARAAGQWERIQRTAESHPYLLYELGASREHRAEHVAWHGVCLPVDDPWWETHFPPNGWGCHCHVRQISVRERDRLQRDGIPEAVGTPVLDEDGVPTGHVTRQLVPLQTEAPPLDLVTYENKRTGQTTQVPRGIDPGFAHRPTIRINQEPPPGAPPGAQTPPDVSEPTVASPAPATPARDRAAGQVEVHASHAEALTALRSVAASPVSQVGPEIREASRRLYQTLEPTARSFDIADERPLCDQLSLNPTLLADEGALGSHGYRGDVVFDSGTWRDARAALQSLHVGREVTRQQRDAIHTVIHETGHEHSPLHFNAWRRPQAGAAEEVMTEVLAREAMRSLGLYTAEQTLRLPFYQDLIDAYFTAIRSHVVGASGWSDEQTRLHLLAAARLVRSRRSVIATELGALRALGEALGVANEGMGAYIDDLPRLR